MTARKNFAVVIPAAGFGSRMGAFKPLLPVGRATAVERVIHAHRSAGVETIIVVGGHRAEELRAAVDPLGVVFVHNPEYERGMFTSIQAGLAALPDAGAGCFIHPVDIPLVLPETLSLLMRVFGESAVEVAFPCFKGKRGHPPLLAAGLIPAVLGYPGGDGLRGLFTVLNPKAVRVECDDDGILMDMDDPADYRKILDRAAGEE